MSTTRSFIVSQRGETARFTLTHDNAGWWCHSGITFLEHPDDQHSFPSPSGWEMLAWNNDIGYHHRREDKCVASVLQAIDRICEDRASKRQQRLDDAAAVAALTGGHA